MSQTDLEIPGRASSIERQDPNEQEHEQKTKSRRPPNTAFRQQRLKAWQPILTPKTVLPLLYIVGVIFAPIGGLLLWASSQVEEISIDYSNCFNDAPNNTWADIPSNKVSSYFKSSNNSGAPQPAQWRRNNTIQLFDGERTPIPQCQIQFEIQHDIGPPVLLYYRLTEFYQNHRRYVKSFDQNQLKGDFRSNSTIDGSDCDPLKTVDGKAIYPCGLIANSLFNDSYTNPILLNAQNVTYNMTSTGIAWSSDKDLYGKTKYANDEVVPPPNWKTKFPKNYTDNNPIPDLHTWEAFQVWMRTAGLPRFSKLALRNDNETMRAGRYEITIEDNFPVNEYGGTKSVLISTRTVMGGKNPFLGIAYVVVGGLCIVLGALFTVLHLIKPRKLGDHTYLTFDQPATATTTGRSLRPGEAEMRA
ncbi:cell division control protein [Rhizodiscina lignyota]|uniref:Cell division control protein n=1 Tax=Rhizodiscina lignyota TaxID=1504668 RepID=A0A9P4IFS5_9PEZI|nr:cell division control protein [Rhizodiscina lignyota]